MTRLTIGEVVARTGLSRHALRYYERDGLMLGVDRDGSGRRRYSESDLHWIDLIRKLRATGMPIRDIRRYTDLVREGNGNEEERLDLLRRHRERVRAQLDMITTHLAALDHKIDYYADASAACVSPDRHLNPPSPTVAAAS